MELSKTYHSYAIIYISEKSPSGLGYPLILPPRCFERVAASSFDDGLRRALAPVHRRYADVIHRRRRRTGHFWQGRFGAVVMDEDHLAAAFRYVSLNPVRARLAERPQDWKWSSVRAHLGLDDDGVTHLRAARQRFARFADLLDEPSDPETFARLRQGESIGRPAGSADFLTRIEALTARSLQPRKRGPKPARDAERARTDG